MQEIFISDCIDKLQSGKRPKINETISKNFAASLGGENIKLDGGLIFKKLRLINDKFFKLMKTGHINYNDILINKDGANTGKFAIYKNELIFNCSTNEHLFIIRSNNKFTYSDYLYCLLFYSSYKLYVKNKIVGSAQPGINSKFLDDLKIKIHSKRNQEKIVNILNKQDKIINNLNKQILKFENLKISIINNYFEDMLKQNKLSNAKLEDVCENQICYGIVQVGPYIENGIPVFSIKEMRKESLKNINRTSKKIEEKYKRSRIKEGDLLLSIKGTTDVLKIVPKKFLGNISRDIAFMRTRQKKLKTNFLRIFFESKLGKQELHKIKVGSTRDELSIKRLKKIDVFSPSTLDEQDELVDKITNIENLIKSLNKNKSKHIFLKKSLTEDFFSFKS